MLVSALGWVLVGGLAVMGVVFVVQGLGRRRVEARARADLADAEARGALPPSLHPRIDPGRCIGSGSCVAVCPENDVLALLDGQARVVSPTSCIGHGECMRACPVDAIELVLGHERRGVDIPLVGSDFETDVPGLYVVGELGGMGLVHNAMSQALQCVDGIRRAARPAPEPPALRAELVPGSPAPVGAELPEGVHQLVIVGAGPAGLAAALAAKEAGLDFVVVDQHSVGGSVLHYPRHKIVMTRPIDLPLYGRLRVSEVRKEALLAAWHDIIERTGLEIRGGVRVDAVEPHEDHGFVVQTSEGPLRTERVVLAMGRRGTPRKLGVPGEERGKVVYGLVEPEAYAGLDCLVVGGGDAGVEAAITLGEAGARVTLAHRRVAFDRIKRKNQGRLDEATAAGRVTVLTEATVAAIGADTVDLVVGGQARTLPNDRVLVFAGGVLPTEFLARAGVSIATFRGQTYAPANR